MLSKGLFTGVMFAALIAVVGCGSNNQLLNQADWRANKENKINARATVFVYNVDFDAKIVSVSSDKMVLEQNGRKSELPTDVISKIVFSGDQTKKKKVIWGSVIGGVLGIAGGYAVGSAASGEKGAGAAAHPLSMAVILGATVGGGFVGSSLTKHEEYTIGNELKPYILDNDLGAEITPAELHAYSIFENLLSDPDDKILQVQIFKLKSGEYFLLYDVTSLGSYSVQWKIVKEEYIETQKAKIKTQK